MLANRNGSCSPKRPKTELQTCRLAAADCNRDFQSLQQAHLVAGGRAPQSSTEASKRSCESRLEVMRDRSWPWRCPNQSALAWLPMPQLDRKLARCSPLAFEACTHQLDLNVVAPQMSLTSAFVEFGAVQHAKFEDEPCWRAAAKASPRGDHRATTSIHCQSRILVRPSTPSEPPTHEL